MSNTEKVELAPCPFCGSDAEKYTEHTPYNAKLYGVSCKATDSDYHGEDGVIDDWCPANCGEHVTFSKESDAVDVWNTRPIEDALNARIAELERKTKGTYCAYCGDEFLFDEECASKVTEHIYKCPEHPMRDKDKRIAELEQQLAEAKRANLEQRVEDICVGAKTLDAIKFALWMRLGIPDEVTQEIEHLEQDEMFTKNLTNYLIEQGVE